MPTAISFGFSPKQVAKIERLTKASRILEASRFSLAKARAAMRKSRPAPTPVICYAPRQQPKLLKALTKIRYSSNRYRGLLL